MRRTMERSSSSLRSAARLSLLRFMAWKEMVSPSLEAPAKGELAPDVPARRAFHFDDAGPRSASRSAADGPGQELAEIEHGDPGQGRRGRFYAGNLAGTRDALLRSSVLKVLALDRPSSAPRCR